MEYILYKVKDKEMEKARGELIDYLEGSFHNYLSTDMGFDRFWNSKDGSFSLSQVLSQKKIIATLSYLVLEEIVRRDGSFSNKFIDDKMINDVVDRMPHKMVRDMELRKLTENVVKPFLEEYKIIKYLKYMPNIKELAYWGSHDKQI